MRKCNVCKKEILVGYRDEYKDVEYCSDVCLYQVYTKEEHHDMYNNDLLYWTDWFYEEEENEEAKAQALTIKGGI